MANTEKQNGKEALISDEFGVLIEKREGKARII